MTLRDVMTQEEHEVTERGASQGMQLGDLLQMASEDAVRRGLDKNGSCPSGVTVALLSHSTCSESLTRALAAAPADRPARLFRAGAADALDGQGRLAGFFGDQAVLLFDHGVGGGVAVETAEDFARNSAVGSLGAVRVEHVEQIEFGARCRLPCHDLSPCFSGRF
jgi:hypothetical protein